jgi:hypothetical protein
MRRFFRDERGQGMALPLIGLVSIMGMTAFTIDVGSWFRADRHMQQVADAAALAGAQALPHDPGKAVALAEEYAAKNSGPKAVEITVYKETKKNDSIRVRFTKPAPGIFSRVVGLESVTVGAGAAAQARVLSKARWVAPIVVNEKHPMLQCKPYPCFKAPTVLVYDHLKKSGPSEPAGAGSFGFIDLGGSSSGTSDLKEQIREGWDQMMPLGQYSARTGNPFSGVSDDLEAMIGEEMLFPVYRSLKSTGTTAEYEIIGWVGFVITSTDLTGSNEILLGHFTRVVWDGIGATDDDDDDDDDGGGTADFGAMTVALTK